MLFMLKKLLASLLLPLPLSLLLLLIGLTLLGWTQRRRSGVLISWLGISLLLIFSINPIASYLLLHLEKKYPPLEKMPTNVKYIVVLGGGNGGSHHYPPNTQLSSASLARLIEAIRLYRQNPNSILVLSGGRVFGQRIDATVMNNTAMALGVARRRMIIEAGSRDTSEEANYLKSLLKKQPFVLVTSAYHMPRAVAIFEAQAMHPVPAPTQFLTAYHHYDPKYYLPNATSLVYSDIALHEYFGIIYLNLIH